ncbi:MAG: sel1 repeat family protein, partial [Planctomycetaceae bacterium]|nr:sel1 repeat family protein [Planctomycetaceae bacterium]
VPQSHVEATRWYEKAANAGHADSQYMLGMYFQYALGEISDLERAKIWYGRAADQGNVKAEKSLAKLIRLTEPEGE